MNILKKIFGGPEERKAREIIKKAEADTSEVYDPLWNLGLGIIKATMSSYQGLGNTLNYSTTGTPTDKQIMVFNEFLYFYMHFTNRVVLGNGLTENNLEIIQNFLGPQMSRTAVETFFGHWPIDLKKRLVHDFFENLNKAEIEYSFCKKLVIVEQCSENESLVGKLSNNIAQLWGISPKDLNNTMLCMNVKEVVLNALNELSLNKLIQDVATKIDRVNIETLTLINHYP